MLLGVLRTMPELETLTVDVVDQTHDGKGVASIDGKRIFVTGALPGERVVVSVRKRRRRYQDAELMRVESRASSRVEPACRFFGRCGGCSLQHMSYEAQLEFKQKVVADNLARLGGVLPDNWLAPVASEQWSYRRRARLSAKFVEAKGRVLIGFRERAAALITDMDSCPVLAPPLDRELGKLAEVIARTRLRARIPQIEMAIGDTARALVVRVLDEPCNEDLEILAEFGHRYEFDVYIQTAGPGSVRPIDTGARVLAYRLDEFDLSLEFAPTDFVQVNSPVNTAMVSEAVQRARVRPSDRVLDLYCGIGNFSLPLAREASELLGIEGDAGLVARAIGNASRNGIDNARFLTADLARLNWSFLAEHWDIVVLDPPRTGAEAAVEQMATIAPRRVIYVSCHPGTLARDARALCERHGFRLASARIFDMFPNTHHVEVMAVFEREG